MKSEEGVKVLERTASQQSGTPRLILVFPHFEKSSSKKQKASKEKQIAYNMYTYEVQS